MSNILGSLRKTTQEREMINAGDRIAVGLSGGKDSMAMLAAHNRTDQRTTIHAAVFDRRFSPHNGG